MFNHIQFRHLIVRKTLKELNLWSPEAEDLLIMTAAHESRGGEYLSQLGDGPAYGVFQMEKGTFNDLWRTLKDEKSPLHKYAQKIMVACDLASPPQPEDMQGNLYLATAMARIYYLRVTKPIPKDIDEMSVYAKKYWNTELGKATPENYLSAYLRFESGN